ncbi:MAG: hypothetical protein Unbinned5179contig1001_21 [Prokaryotic dsDNA virus sp.]|nr:MAG: hypothetical protein Unbinned5179contig1001_21 [Prokaryotic dsDNA virus sp.]
MQVRPEDVRDYGSSAAIVLSVLRSQGCTASMPVLVQYAAIGRLCGLDQRSVRRGIDRLTEGKAISVSRYRQQRSLMVKLRHCAEVVTRTAADGQNVTTQVDVESLAQESPPLRRLDSVRSLLDALG